MYSVGCAGLFTVYTAGESSRGAVGRTLSTVHVRDAEGPVGSAGSVTVALSVYVPDAIPDVELELVVVLRS